MSVLRFCGKGPTSPLRVSMDIIKTHRHLPHWQRSGAIYWITFRLADSIPQSKLKYWKHERDLWLHSNPRPWDPETEKQYQILFGERQEHWLDAGYGSCALRKPDCRKAVWDGLMRFHNARLQIHHGVIMPNHVHLLLEPLNGESLSKLLKGIKGASARVCNQILNRKGTFWMEDSYDRIVRNREEYAHYVRYINGNPVRAKLRDGEYCFLP